LRLIIGPSPRAIALPEGHRLTFGRGTMLTDGEDAILFGYGPVMLHEALLAAEILQGQGFGLRVVALPWLNRVDEGWLDAMVKPFTHVYVMEDHSSVGGLGDHLRRDLARLHPGAASNLKIFGVDGYPACGRPKEVLEHHELDGQSISRRILLDARGRG
jgi:transketolase